VNKEASETFDNLTILCKTPIKRKKIVFHAHDAIAAVNTDMLNYLNNVNSRPY